MDESVASDWAAYIGACAAFLSSLSYIPQVRKAWPRESTNDLSLGMLTALTCGLSLWIVYGIIREDWVIIAANGVGTTLAALVLTFKVKDIIQSKHPANGINRRICP